MGDHVVCVRERRGVFRILVEKHEGKRQFWRHRQEGKIILKWTFKNWVGGMNWIDMAQDRVRWRAVGNAVMNLCSPQNMGNFVTIWGPLGFSRRTLPYGVLYVCRQTVNVAFGASFYILPFDGVNTELERMLKSRISRVPAWLLPSDSY
jgi:hypothetical protein